NIVGSDGTVTVNRAKPDKKADGGWTIANKGNYPVPPATIKPVLDGLAALREIEPKTERSALYDRLDLKNPGKDSQSHGVTLSGENGATLASVVLGKHKYDNGAGNNDRQYVRIPGTNQAWLAGPAVTLPDETLDWIDKSVLDLDPYKIK
ncbi:DUF4340 domain-containing protein, partial [Pseudomonas sivasensis]|uniref:DUF4340 domain-containing protein n=1 Tax=Pseudomonas sivasensis TaxID=1880678 RepID=UPI0030D91CF3